MTRHDLVTLDGVTQPLIEWALDYGIPIKLLLNRIRLGMPVVKAITKPMPVKPGQKLDDEAWGVVGDFLASAGTGAGSTAQEIPKITFSEQAENT